MRGPSIKDALNGNLFSDEKVVVQEQHTIYSGKTGNEGFTREQLKASWDEFLKTIENRPSLKAALSACPELKEDYRLELNALNSMQEEMVRNIKPRLVSWLRNSLNNSNIDIVIKVDEHKTERIIYSDMDKYQEMVKKNPSLALLRQKFNLDFEG